MKTINFVGVDDLSISIDWNRALLLLSLDLIDRYWSELGLDFEDNGRIRRPIRAYVEAEQALDDLSEEQYHFSMESDLINDLFEKIANDSEKLAVAKVQNWIEKKFLVAETDRWTRKWRYISVLSEKYPVFSGIGMNKLSVLNTIIEKISDIDDQTATEMENLEKEPKSEWDARQYALYRKENVDASPLHCFESYLDHWRFVDVWHEILALLTPAELNVLELWAKGVHEAEGEYGAPEILTIPPEYRHPE